jgi:hypothetical protein
VIIPVKTIGEVVAEASKKMSDPNYSAVLVGSFVQSQRDAAQYVSAHAGEIGGAEGVVNTIFHASLIAQCFQRGYGRSVRSLTFADLDHAAEGDRDAALKTKQPHVLEYITANIENASVKGVLILLALAMEWAS